ncbi:MAG: stage 0 sporulation family protein [Tissierellia bacterium]|nr:stage 0 sporulation family protein [Tissierellia bacterium]
MKEIIGVRFKKACKIYYFDPCKIQFEKGDKVIVNTIKGMEMGEVVIENSQIDETKFQNEISEIVRKALDSDIKIKQENKIKAKEAIKICEEKIDEFDLDMSLVDCEFTFDRSKVIFYFTSDRRVDFRDLVKDLASIFKNRIELRQIGVRDQAKMMGGMGICGQVCCCHRFLKDFTPVSVKMAKEQNLTLNPSKISGTCGRLMCCLNYEQEVYDEISKKLPKVGQKVITEDGMGYVVGNDIILEKSKVRIMNNDQEFEKFYSENQMEKLDEFNENYIQKSYQNEMDDNDN